MKAELYENASPLKYNIYGKEAENIYLYKICLYGGRID